MILMRAKMRTNINPVAIGAPRVGKTCLQIVQTPKDEREPTRNSSESEEKAVAAGGADDKLRTVGRRCSLAEVQLGNPGLTHEIIRKMWLKVQT